MCIRDRDYRANKKAVHAQLEQQARELLAQMGLSERADHYPHQLSGEVLRVLRELADRRTTMIIVTHEMQMCIRDRGKAVHCAKNKGFLLQNGGKRAIQMCIRDSL